MFYEKALLLAKDIGMGKTELDAFLGLAISKLSQGAFQEGYSYLLHCIQKFEELRNFLSVNDAFKTSFLERAGVYPYEVLNSVLSFRGNHRDALYVEELRRARGLSDLMANQYSIAPEITADPSSWFGIENILKKEKKCVCLYISLHRDYARLWILKRNGAIHYKEVTEVTRLFRLEWMYICEIFWPRPSGVLSVFPVRIVKIDPYVSVSRALIHLKRRTGQPRAW